MHRNTPHTSEITVRLADQTDARALLHPGRAGLRERAGRRLVIAESDGELVAAVPVDGGRPIADPFRGTTLILEMLELRAAQIRSQQGAPAGDRRPRALAGGPPAGRLGTAAVRG